MRARGREAGCFLFGKQSSALKWNLHRTEVIVVRHTGASAQFLTGWKFRAAFDFNQRPRVRPGERQVVCCSGGFDTRLSSFGASSAERTSANGYGVVSADAYVRRELVLTASFGASYYRTLDSGPPTNR